MRACVLLIILVSLSCSSFAQTDNEGPATEKAQKTYKQALEYLKQHMEGAAFDAFKKADKQDDGHCTACEKKMIKYGTQFGDWKAAELGGQELVDNAKGPNNIALAHYLLGRVYMTEAMLRHKDEFYPRANAEMEKALAAAPNFADALFVDGQILARLNQDDAAKARFGQFIKIASADDPTRQRALRYISDPELARARMAPAFSITTTDGQRISLDELKGKVVLIDFWATWCGPCRAALPHMRDLAKKFQGQPLLILSVSLDDDENKWEEFVAKNQMTWPQYYDGGFKGQLATLFSIHAIPQTFTIDSDGVLQDQHIDDAAIEGKLKKLVAKARELQVADAPKPPDATK
jgi:thiol-disulfide isomerase/thioredoxin